MDYVTSEATDNVFKALLAFHKDPPPIIKEGKILMHNKERKYLTLDSILHAVRPALASQGLFIMQHLAGDSLITIIQHESGQFIQSYFPFQTMQGSGTNNLQNLGGGLTYLRRYALTAILGIAADEDDDGNAGGIEKKGESEATPGPTKWLNSVDKAGNITPEWNNLLKGISDGKINTLNDVRKYYKVSKEVAIDVNKALGL